MVRPMEPGLLVHHRIQDQRKDPPLLVPEQCAASYPAIDAAPAAMRDEVVRLRATVAGRFALGLYAHERRRPP